MSRKRVVMAMSGGVDSSTACALLVRQGYDVIGVTMQLWKLCEQESSPRMCCSMEAIEDARKVANILGIPHHVMNFERDFYEKVVKDFIDEYKAGRTPNPCIRCNSFIKFDALIRRAAALSADIVATGHYARSVCDENSGRFHLLKGKDMGKDQSYFLYDLSQEQLKRILFPLGEYTKEEVRQIAEEMGLPIARKGESQEICFIPDDDYARFLGENVGDTGMPGPIYDMEGKLLGNHKGLFHYTVGQRKGIGISSPEPYYVVRIAPAENAIYVGRDRDLFRSAFLVEGVRWVSIVKPLGAISASVRIRYRTKESPAVIGILGDDAAFVSFQEPQRAITPGQSAVFYDGDRVLGGGTIKEVRSNIFSKEGIFPQDVE